jgi:hypothetical protein
MAELLKQQYDVIVLQVQAGVGLGASRGSRESLVRFTLQYHEGARLVDGPRWECLLGSLVPLELDRSTTRGPGPSITLPEPLISGLRGWFEEYRISTETEGRFDRPLWVHLVKPYGLLRIVPWERVLGEALGLPILMLPDFIFPPPREAMSMLDVVLCGSAPLGFENWSVHQAMQEAADRILECVAAGRRVRLHVFADGDIAQWLSDQWQADGRLGTTIIVHDHDLAAPYVSEDTSSRLVDETGRLRSPWLLWMREALKDVAVDVVHLVCHGHFAANRGALLFAQSPLERTDRYLAGPVSATELGTFLTQTGAWSTVFTCLPDNHSALGLRWLADEIAQSRPGPMMMHTRGLDPGGQALAAGYSFLYGRDRGAPPRSTALFLYCQPYLEAGLVDVPSIARNVLQQDAAARSSREASPLDSFFGGEHVSRLVASTERFTEQVELRYQQLARDELLPSGGARAPQVQATFDTLAKLRAAVADVEARSASKDSAADSRLSDMLRAQGQLGEGAQ